jgi:hypothetical protein
MTTIYAVVQGFEAFGRQYKPGDLIDEGEHALWLTFERGKDKVEELLGCGSLARDLPVEPAAEPLPAAAPEPEPEGDSHA